MNERHLTMQSEEETMWIPERIHQNKCRGNLVHFSNLRDTTNLKFSFLLVKFPFNENFLVETKSFELVKTWNIFLNNSSQLFHFTIVSKSTRGYFYRSHCV